MEFGKSMMQPIPVSPILTNWSIITRESNDGLRFCLNGNVFGHPDYDINDGDVVTTSPIEYFDGVFHKTETRSYKLHGPANPRWLATLNKLTPEDIFETFRKKNNEN